MSIFNGSETGTDGLSSSNFSSIDAIGSLAGSGFDASKNITQWILSFSQRSQHTGGDSVIIQIGGSLGAVVLIWWIYICESWLADARLILEPVDKLDDDIRKRSNGKENIEDVMPYGLDAKAYRNFNRTCAFISSAQVVPALYLLYLDYQFNISAQTITLSTWASIFSMANVKGKLLYFHFAYGFWVSLTTCIGVLGSIWAMNRERQEYFDRMHLQPTWLMFTGGLSQWEQLLKGKHYWEDCISKLKPGVKLRKRHKKTLAFNKMVRKLEHCGTAYAGLLRRSNLVSNMQTRRTLRLKAKDQLKEFVRRVQELDKEFAKHEKMDRKRSCWNCFGSCCTCCSRKNNKDLFDDESNQSSNYGFLLFRDHQAARFHLKRLLLADQPWWQRMCSFFFKARVEMAPEPEAICYVGINRHRAIRWFDTLKSLSLMAITIFIYTMCIVLISGLANLQDYVPNVTFLRSIWDWQVGGQPVGQRLITIICGVIPPALAYAARFILVPIIRRWAHLRGGGTFPSRDQMIFVWYFGVLFCCHLVCFTLLDDIQETVQAVWNDWVQHGFQGAWDAWEAIQQFPAKAVAATVGSANYWLCSLGLQCGISAFTVVEPMRVFQLKFLPWLRGHKGTTQREKKHHEFPSSDDFPIVKDSANLCLMQAVISTYAMVTPLVTIVGCVANLIHMRCTTMRLKHVHRTRGEGQGHLYFFWINRLLFCAGVVQPSVVAMSLIVNIGAIGIPIALVPAVFVGLFKLEISYATISNILAGRSRKHYAGWSLEDTYHYGKEVREQMRYLEAKEAAKAQHVSELELRGHGNLYDKAEREVKRRLNHAAHDVKELQESLKERGFNVKELEKTKGQPTEEMFNRYTAMDIASRYADMKLSDEEVADHLHALIEVIAMEARLQPINIDDPEEVRGLAYPPKQPPNFLRPTESIDECPRRDNDKHQDLQECRKVCRINTFMEWPAFAPEDFAYLETGFRRLYPLMPYLKWTEIYREVRLSIGDLRHSPLDLVRARACEPFEVVDSKARPPYSQ